MVQGLGKGGEGRWGMGGRRGGDPMDGSVQREGMEPGSGTYI